MSSNKKTGVVLGVLLSALVSALVMPLVCLVSACVRTHKEPKQKNRLAHSNSKKKQSTALGMPLRGFMYARARAWVCAYVYRAVNFFFVCGDVPLCVIKGKPHGEMCVSSST